MAANNPLNPLVRTVVPFALIEPNQDNPGLKDFSPVIVPADAPGVDEDPKEEVTAGGAESTAEAGDDGAPKVDSSAQGSAPSSPKPSEEGVPSVEGEDPVTVAKGNSSKAKVTPPKE